MQHEKVLPSVTIRMDRSSRALSCVSAELGVQDTWRTGRNGGVEVADEHQIVSGRQGFEQLIQTTDHSIPFLSIIASIIIGVLVYMDDIQGSVGQTQPQVHESSIDHISPRKAVRWQKSS